MPPAHAAALLPHGAHEAARVGGRRLHRGCSVSRTQSSRGTAAARWLGVCGCYASRSAAVPPEAIRVKAPQLLPRPRLSALNSVNSDAAHYWRCTTLLAYDVQLLAAPALGSLRSLGRQAAAAELLQPNIAVSIRAASDAASAAGARVGGPARGAARRRCRTVLRTRRPACPGRKAWQPRQAGRCCDGLAVLQSLAGSGPNRLTSACLQPRTGCITDCTDMPASRCNSPGLLRADAVDPVASAVT